MFQFEVSSENGCVLLVCGSGVYMYPVILSTPTLSAALGKFAHTPLSQVSIANSHTLPGEIGHCFVFSILCWIKAHVFLKENDIFFLYFNIWV